MFEKIKGFLGYGGAGNELEEETSSDIPETIYVGGREYRETDWSRVKRMTRAEIVANAIDAIRNSA